MTAREDVRKVAVEGALAIAEANRAQIEVSRDDERVMVCIKKDKTVVEIRLEPKAALELAVAIATRAKKISEE